MAAYFIDTSAVAKLYVLEAGTEKMLEVFGSQESHALALSSITPLELRSAIRRRQRAGDIPDDAASKIVTQFTQHVESRFERVAVNEPLIERALALVDRHGLRAYDALQLASCLQWKAGGTLDAPVFVCSDGALLAAALAEGVATLDPAGAKKVR